MPRSTRNSSDSMLPVPPSSTSASSLTSSQGEPTSVVTNAAAPAEAAVPSPELVASIVEALKEPLSAMVNSAVQAAGVNSSSLDSLPISSGPSTGGDGGPTDLHGRTHHLVQAGASSPWFQTSSTAHAAQSGASLARPLNQGMFPPLGVPSFIPTLSQALHSPPPPVSTSQQPLSAFSAPLPSVLHTPPLNQPFVVGPGYSPVPYKVVAQIVAGKFINLEDLLPENISVQEPEPQVMLDGRLFYSPGPKRAKRQINDVTTWVEAFTIFSLILDSYFPHRWTDLLKYKLLILRTYRQFSGSAWLNYDREFRELAAAENCTTWAVMNVQLYNFHTAGAHVRPRIAASSTPNSKEAHGSAFSKVVCHSWNAGFCVAPTSTCRFRHACSKCEGDHRRSACPEQTPYKKKERAQSVELSDLKRRKRR